MNRVETSITTYQHGEYRIDITIEPNGYLAYLYKPPMGDKVFIIGAKNDRTPDDFVQLVGSSIEKHIEAYKQIYED